MPKTPCSLLGMFLLLLIFTWKALVFCSNVAIINPLDQGLLAGQIQIVFKSMGICAAVKTNLRNTLYVKYFSSELFIIENAVKIEAYLCPQIRNYIFHCVPWWKKGFSRFRSVVLCI